ncbi:MAG: formylglycine-generating enzyme family protein [Phototrophicaceae bacterium]
MPLESFNWIDIPHNNYAIAKYPVTNKQFNQFIEASAYDNQQWWTEQGWQTKQAQGWIEPAYWHNNDLNSARQPVVGISWYEAIAFCLWASAVSNKNILLPTETQWQYASQGEDGRNYPWGNDWHSANCHNSVDVDLEETGVTVAVNQFEGKGDSPFGVVGMSGNIWEWCLTDYTDLSNDMNTEARLRVFKGGSWDCDDINDFRCDARDWGIPHARFDYSGFRVVSLEAI